VKGAAGQRCPAVSVLKGEIRRVFFPTEASACEYFLELIRKDATSKQQ
jgi:hypothetical protein